MRTASCFIWGKMRTIAQETAFRIALRNCCRVVGRRSVNMWFWWRGSSCNQAHIFCRRLLLVSQRFLLVMRCSCQPWRILVLVCIWGDGAFQVAPWSRIYLPVQETQEMWVWSLGQKIPWRRRWQPAPVFLPGMDREAWRAIILEVAKSRMTERLSTDMKRYKNWAHTVALENI